MKLLRPLQMIAIFAGTFLCLSDGSFGAEVQMTDRSSLLKGQAKVYSVLSDQIQTDAGLTCVTDRRGMVVVSAVRPGAAAFDVQVQVGDQILRADLEGEALTLTIRRNGKNLIARLRCEVHPTLVAQAPKADRVIRKPFTLNIEKSQLNDDQFALAGGAQLGTPGRQDLDANQFALSADKGFKLLANYNIELIVDRSMSMRERDCPDGFSRWEWLGVQAANLANSVSPYVPHGLTVIPFATEYDVFENARAQDIDEIFNGVGQQFGTRLFEPLADRIDNYFTHNTAHEKPLLIVVLTDGVPVPKIEPALVVKELIEATHHMTSPWQATVIFGQIGGKDKGGKRYLADLESNLTTYGARYPIVHTISFETLEEHGLGPALVAAIEQYAPRYAKLVKSPPAVQVAVGNRIQRHIPNPQAEQVIGSRLRKISPVNCEIDVAAINDLLSQRDQDPFRNDDTFVDHPRIDQSGARQFLNGKHFDLTSVSIYSAIDSVKHSVLNSWARGPGAGIRTADRLPRRLRHAGAPSWFDPLSDEP